MPKKPRKRSVPKQRDPSWRMRDALGHKVEANPKAYTRKLKHPKEDDPEGTGGYEAMIKWLLKWLNGKPVPKYLSGKKRGRRPT